jgi:hypothetical protein
VVVKMLGRVMSLTRIVKRIEYKLARNMYH